MFYDDKKPSETNPDGFKTHILAPYNSDVNLKRISLKFSCASVSA